MSRAFVVRVSNSDAAMQAYVARQTLQYGLEHRHAGSDLLLCTCVWAIGEFGELLSGTAHPLLEDEEPWTGDSGCPEAAAALLDELTQAPRSSEVRSPSQLRRGLPCGAAMGCILNPARPFASCCVTGSSAGPYCGGAKERAAVGGM